MNALSLSTVEVYTAGGDSLSVPCNPPCSTGVQESKLSHEVAGRPVLGGLPTYLMLSSSSNHVICMIIACSLHDYIRTCQLYIGTFFYSLFSLLSLRLA